MKLHLGYTFLILLFLVEWSEACETCGGCNTCRDFCASDCSHKCSTHSCREACHQSCTSSCKTECNSCTNCESSCSHSCCQNCCAESSCRKDCCSSSHDCCEECCTTSSCRDKCRNDCNNTCSNQTQIIYVTEKSQIPAGREGHKSESSAVDVNVSPILNVTNVIQLNNTVTNVNKVYVPVNVTVTNINNITPGGGSNGRTTTTVIERKCENGTNCKPTTVPVNVPVPVPVPMVIRVPVPVPVRIPVSVPVPIPYPTQQPRGCCTVMIPCVHPGCTPYNRVCGNDCMFPFMFSPRNPCGYGGCHRRSAWNRILCYSTGSCHHLPVDCNSCGNDFYQDYSSYMNCGGCFQ